MKLKKLQENITNEIEQETRKAKMEKESVIKLVFKVSLILWKLHVIRWQIFLLSLTTYVDVI